MYNWKYTVYGKHYKKNYEWPTELLGRCKVTFQYKSTMSHKEKIDYIKNLMREDIKETCRERARLQMEPPDDEEIDVEREYFEFYNICEVGPWSDLEDFRSSK